MDDKTKVILLALECLLKTVASHQPQNFSNTEDFNNFINSREKYIQSTIKYINNITGEK